MTVFHPRMTSGAITFEGADYAIAADGEVDCPEDVEAALADHLADAHGVPRGDIYEEDGPPDGAAVPDHTPDVSDDLEDLTYDELYERAQEADVAGRSEMDSDELRAALRED